MSPLSADETRIEENRQGNVDRQPIRGQEKRKQDPGKDGIHVTGKLRLGNEETRHDKENEKNCQGFYAERRKTPSHEKTNRKEDAEQCSDYLALIEKKPVPPENHKEKIETKKVTPFPRI